LLDTLSSKTEKDFLHNHFGSINHSPSPLMLRSELDLELFFRSLMHMQKSSWAELHVLTLGVDVNRWACTATEQTVSVAEHEQSTRNLSHGFYLET